MIDAFHARIGREPRSSKLRPPSRRPSIVRRRAALQSLLLMVAIGCLGAGCRRFSPLEPLRPTPAQLGDVIEASELRSPDAATLNAAGDITFGGAGLLSWLRRTHRAGMAYRAPAQFRLRIQNPGAGGHLDIFQDGEQVAVQLPDYSLYAGTVQELSEHARQTGGLEPREIVRAILIEETLREAVSRSSDARPEDVPFQGDALKFQLADENGRRETYTIRRRDGLVKRAVVEVAGGDGKKKVHTVAYKSYQQGPDGRPLPKAFEIKSGGVKLKIEIALAQNGNPVTRFDAPLPPDAFDLEAAPANARPLRELFEAE